MSGEYGAHSASKDPLKLFLPDPDRQVTWLSDKALPIMGAVMGVGPFIFGNLGYKMPWYAGIWRHVLGGIVGGIAGYYYDQYREERIAEKNAYYHWYITQHPAEFPAPERRKVGDMLKPWIPHR